MKTNFSKRPLAKVISVWCAFATIATSTAPAFAATQVLSDAVLNRDSGNITVTTDTYVGTITSTDSRDAVLDWGKLNIRSSETLNFNGGVSFYNVVSSSGGQSKLMGKLNGNNGANVYIFNQNGILVGEGAVISVEGIFGAYAMAVSDATLNNWLANPSDAASAKFDSSNTARITVEDGAQIKAKAIELAGKGIVIKGADATFDGPTTLTAGGKLVFDRVLGGDVAVVFSDNTTTPSDGIELMGSFTKALTAKTSSISDVDGAIKIMGATSAGGDVTIEAGSISTSEALDSSVTPLKTTGKLTATAKKGDIELGVKKEDGTYVWNGVAGKVTLTAEKGDVAFYNGVDGDTAIVGAKAQNVTLETKNALSVNGAVEATAGDVSLTSTDGSVGIAGSVTAKQNATVDAGTTATITGNVKAPDGDVSVTAKDQLLVKAAEAEVMAGGNVTLVSTDADVGVVGTVTADKGVSATAKTDVTVAGAIEAKDGNATLTATAGKVTVKGPVSATGGDVTLTGGTGVEVASGCSVSATATTGTDGTITGGNVSLTTTSGNVTTDANTALIAGGNLVVNAENETEDVDGFITINGKATVGGTTTLNAKKDIVADNEANDFKGLVDATSTKGNVTLVDANSIQLNKIDAAKHVSITAKNGDVTMEKDDTLLKAGKNLVVTAEATDAAVEGKIALASQTEVAESTTLTAKGSIVADNENNDFGGNVNASSAKDSVTLVDANSISLNNISAATTVDVTATAGNIEVVENGTVTALDGGVTLKAGDSVTVDKNATVSANGENGKIDIDAENGAITIKDSAQLFADGSAELTAKTDVTVEKNASVEVAGGNAILTADRAALISGNVTAQDDAKVIAGTTATFSDNAKLTTTKGDITVSAGKDIALQDKAIVAAGNAVTLTTEDGDVTTAAETQLSADGISSDEGDKLVVTAKATSEGVNGDITIGGKAEVKGTTALDAAGSIAANNAENDFQGLVNAKAGSTGSVSLKDKDTIQLNDIDAGTTVDVTAKNIEVVANTEEEDAGVNAGGKITFTADEAIVVNNDVTSSKDGISFNGTSVTVEDATVKAQSTTGTIDIDATGAVDVKGTAQLIADADVDVYTTGGDVTTEADTSLTAGGNLVVKTDNGNITLAGKATVSGETHLNATKDIVANNTDNDFVKIVNAKSTEGKVELVAAKTILLNDIDAKTTVDVTAENIEVVENAADDTGVDAGGSIAFKADEAITVNNEVTSAKDGITFNAGTSVKVNKATVTANGTDGNIDIAAKTGVELTGTATSKASLDAAQDIKIATEGGNVTTEADTSLIAGRDLDMDADAGSITIDGTATVTENTYLDANGSIAANNANNHFEGNVDAKADTGSVALKDKGTIKLNDVDAATTVTVDAKNIEVVANPADNTGVDADGKITFTATDAITVNNDVTSEKDGITFNAGTSVTVEDATVTANGENGNILIDAETGKADISGSVTASQNATVNAKTTASVSGNGLVKATAGDVTVLAENDVTVTGNAIVEAGKAVSLKSTDTGDVTIDTAETVTAKDGAVAIAANEGAVTVKNATVMAKNETGGAEDPNGNIVIDATAGIEVSDGANLIAAKNIKMTTTGGDVTTVDGTSLTAGDSLLVNAVNGDVTIGGTATVEELTDLDANGSIVANNADNDFKGLVNATANGGSVELVDANEIQLNDVDADTFVSVEAEDIVVVANNDADTGVNAGERINLNADNSIAVNNAVEAETQNIVGTATAGDITFGAKGSMKANEGSVLLAAAKNIDSANAETAIMAENSIVLGAGGDIGSPLNVNAPELIVAAEGSANVAMKKGEFNESGDLAVNGSTTSIETGKDLKLAVEGNLSTPDDGVIKVGNNLDLAVNSATPEIDLTLGGSTIRATDKTDAALAFKLHGGNKYPTVIGTDSDTAVFIDGRLAGGDSAYYSILGSYEALAALGMTPDIRGAKADEAPVLFRDKNQNVIDVLPNTWDAQLDDAAVVPEEAKSSDAASKVARR